MRLARPMRSAGGQQVGGRRLHQRLDLALGLVGELVAVGVEQLDAVVGVGIVGGRDHDAEVGAQRAGQHGDRRRRHRPQQEHVHADGGEARHQRRFDHVAGEPRVLADDHAMPVGAAGEQLARGHADLERDLGGHGRAVGEPANAIGAEVPPRHACPRLVFCRATGAALGRRLVKSWPAPPLWRCGTRPSIKSCKQRLHQLQVPERESCPPVQRVMPVSNGGKSRCYPETRRLPHRQGLAGGGNVVDPQDLHALARRRGSAAAMEPPRRSPLGSGGPAGR